MPGSRRVVAAKIISVVAFTLLSLLSVVRAAYPTPPGRVDTWKQFLHDFFLDWYLVLILGATVVGLGARVVEEWLSSEEKSRIRGMLDALLVACFPNTAEGERHFNRATLFRANRARTRLKPWVRSGTQYQRGIQAFKIDDDNERGNEGVAGLAWFKGATVIVNQLPETPAVWSVGDERCRKYAVQGLIPLEKAGRLHIKSRSLLATPVRNYKGHRWGILVIDSRQPTALDASKQQTATSFALAIGKVL